MREHRLLDAIESGPILLDAGIGYRLLAHGIDFDGDDPALWNETHPATIRGLHAADLAAGADAVLSNTFGANAVWLDRFGRRGDAAHLNRLAVALARDAAGPDRFVLGSIGPTSSDSPEASREQAGCLAECGVDGLILETHRLDQAIANLAVMRASIAIPILVSIVDTAEPRRAVAALRDAGADVVGVNCISPAAAAAWVEAAALERDEDALPMLCKPSAISPEGMAIEPESFARAIAGVVVRGARLLGGCCGADHRHVAALRSTLVGAAEHRSPSRHAR